MNIYNQALLGAVFLVNLFTFILMFADKEKAKRAQRRISEKTLFLGALFFGGVGVYAGMLAFRHKTQKWHFRLGVPLIIVFNIYVITKIFLAFSNNIG